MKGKRSAQRRNTDEATQPFAVFDIDGTLIRWQLYHAIADRLVSLGFIAPVKFQEIKEARMVWKRREDPEAFRNYELKLVKLYEQILQEITVEQFEQAVAAVFEEYKDQVYRYTRDLIKQLKAKGYLIFAISGSQAQAVTMMAEYYGFDDFVARVEGQKGNRFSGQFTSPIHDKAEALRQLIKRNKVGLASSIAVGDSKSDIKMLEVVEQPIAFNPELELYEQAKTQGWPIVVERKNVIYELKADGQRYILA